jgi:hypothetical protein
MVGPRSWWPGGRLGPAVRITHGVWDTSPGLVAGRRLDRVQLRGDERGLDRPGTGGEARPLSPGLPSFDFRSDWLPDGSGVIYQQTGGAVPADDGGAG